MPETTPFQFPAGMRLAAPIEGADADGGECPEKDATVGSGQGVVVCMPLCFDSTYSIGDNGQIIPLPIGGGLIINSQFRDGQNGLLVERVVLNVHHNRCLGGLPEDDTEEKKKERWRQAFVVELRLQCLNEKRSPSFSGMSYDLAGYTADPALKELILLLANKRIETDEHQEVLMEAVYAITESSGLTPDLRARIARLPNRA